ncbi:putative membrane protein [Senna tora]|uniref:Putative membrane protein n=1 Tax=Senna tora TaxID=362788 RepID=A0A834WN42_9FABA|nr:putative membrane protein [Senna tora]
MEVPVGFLAKLRSFLSFLPFFFLLLILGVLKAAIICPFAVSIIVIGNAAVIIGLWVAHVVWTYYCVVRTKKVGMVFKIVVLISLPVPLFLWPIVGIVGSFLGGIGYGFFSPLLATFEAVGADVVHKLYHCLIDGCWSTIERSCTVVQDFTDFCFHSYFSYMDELREDLPPNEMPIDLKLSILPGCFLVMVVGVPFDMALITSIAIWKSPYLLFRGWKRLLEDLVGREGPFLETMCVPFAGLTIILWPLAVVGALLAASISSLFLGLYSGIVVHQEDSMKMGFAYIVSVVSLFDEYANDLLYLREGSCLPRPRYRKNMTVTRSCEHKGLGGNDGNDTKHRREGLWNSRNSSQHARTLKEKIQRYRLVQVWDWLFKSCEINGRILLRDGLISVKDVEECLMKGNSDDIELTRMNEPRDKVFEWFIGPLLIMKEQLKKLRLEENEEMCLKELVMRCKNEIPEEWDSTGFPSNDNVRRAQLQAIIRRLQGIVVSMSRIPTFRRRFRNLVKVLYIEALQASASASHIAGNLIPKYSGKGSTQSTVGDDVDESSSNVKHRAYQYENLV